MRAFRVIKTPTSPCSGECLTYHTDPQGMVWVCLGRWVFCPPRFLDRCPPPRKLQPSTHTLCLVSPAKSSLCAHALRPDPIDPRLTPMRQGPSRTPRTFLPISSKSTKLLLLDQGKHLHDGVMGVPGGKEKPPVPHGLKGRLVKFRHPPEDECRLGRMR